MTEHRSSNVQSVERAIAVLRSFSLRRPERAVGELSRELGLHKSTISRLMSTLEQGGLLSRDPETRRYRLGIDLIGLAAQVVSYRDVREVARPKLRRLAEECEESVNLVVLDFPSTEPGDAAQVVNLEQFVPPTRQVTNIGRAGRRTCCHCTAAGKVLLAHLSPGELDRALPSHLERLTPTTISDPQELRLELERVREMGYAVAQAELEEGLNVVAAPIFDHTGQVIAAATVAGPAYRLTAERLPMLALQLMEVTGEISRELGHKAGP
jgi:DNA-binding IclR family transcriptional regulator